MEMTPKEWWDWILIRSTGKDKFFSYGREKREEYPAYIFESVANFRRHASIDLENARKGAAQALSSIDPCTENPVVTLNAMYIARFFTLPDCDEGAGTVARWIRESVLLKSGNQQEGRRLLRSALLSLAELQRVRAGECLDIWREYFRRSDDSSDPFFYVVAAFTGLIIASPKIPSDEVVELLDLSKLAEYEGRPLALKGAFAVFWEKWGRENCNDAIVKKLEKDKDGEQKWELLRNNSPSSLNLNSWNYHKISGKYSLNPYRVKSIRVL